MDTKILCIGGALKDMDGYELKKELITALSQNKIRGDLLTIDLNNSFSGDTNLDYLEYINGSLLLKVADALLTDLDGKQALKPRLDGEKRDLYNLRDKASGYFLDNKEQITSGRILQDYILDQAKAFQRPIIDYTNSYDALILQIDYRLGEYLETL